MEGAKLGRYELSSLVLMRTISPFHIGIGRVIGTVDMPIARDSLGFPVVPASSLKGALRAHFIGDPYEKVIFGPEVGEEAYAGALAVTEGYLLTMPARSLRGIWLLISSPLLVRRFAEGLRLIEIHEPQNIGLLLDKANALLKAAEDIKSSESLVCKDGRDRLSVKIKDKEQVIVNEEFLLECKESDSVRDFFESLKVDEPWRAVLVHDDCVREIVERSILRRSRIRLKRETKTVEGGGLWSEEDVPSNALFFTTFLYSKSRSAKEEPAKCIKEVVLKRLFTDPEGKRGYVIFGGHETIGRGIVELIGVTGC